jgi:uncharacterized membrane protein
MASTDLIYEYRWAIAAVLVVLFLLSRYVMRRVRERREARRRLSAQSGEIQLLTPEGYRRARTQFLLSLALLIVIVFVALLTRFG